MVEMTCIRDRKDQLSPEECQVCYGSWSRGGEGEEKRGRRGRSEGRGRKLLLRLETGKASQKCHLS